MKLDKLFLALFVIGLLLFAVPGNVYADGDNNSSGSDDDSTDENNSSEDDSEDEVEIELENETESDENETEDEDVADIDEEDISILKENHGAEVRLLQLQKSVVKQLKMGKLILNEIDNQNFSVNTTELEGYVEDLADLNVKITEALAEEPFNVTVEEYVAMRHEATKITFQFKAELYDLLTPEQLKIIKDAIQEKGKYKDSNELKVEEKLKIKAKEFNQDVALKMLEKFGGNDEDLKERIMAGNLTSKELKVELREEYKNLGEARKNQLKIKIKEEKSNELKEKYELEAKSRGLNRSEVTKIVQDDSLTWEEKQAKIRILAQEQKELHNQGNSGKNNGGG